MAQCDVGDERHERRDDRRVVAVESLGQMFAPSVRFGIEPVALGRVHGRRHLR